MVKKILFIDRDGTLIDEPEDKQVDSLSKLALKPGVIPALLALQKRGYQLVMVTNQDGLGTNAFPENDFSVVQSFLIQLLRSQGIYFDQVLICPHFLEDGCACRKPQLGLVMQMIRSGEIDFNHSYMIGDRQSDLDFATNLGVVGLLFGEKHNWNSIALQLDPLSRISEIQRATKETNINIKIDLDSESPSQINTGLRFFDHMLEQLAKQAGFSLQIRAQGDLDIDEHHTVEDVAIVLGQALRKALGDKWGIARYGFVLPMDEACAQVAIDLSGRSYFKVEAEISREKVGDLPVELVPHFFRSFSENLGATLHIKVEGENAHHMIESMFKGVGRVLKQAIAQESAELPSTKGVL